MSQGADTHFFKVWAVGALCWKSQWTKTPPGLLLKVRHHHFSAEPRMDLQTVLVTEKMPSENTWV